MKICWNSFIKYNKNIIIKLINLFNSFQMDSHELAYFSGLHGFELYGRL